MNAIEIKNLKKYFKDVKAVDDISLTVKEGELYAFLGLNGAGKSTTISIICGQLTKTDGKVFVNGYDIDTDIDKIKSDIGIVFQSSALDKQLTVRENLRFRASLYGITGAKFDKKIEEFDSMFELADFLDRPYGKLSGGQKRRVDFARALIHNPKILILDEPTTGLDPQSRIMVWRCVDKLRKERKMTVFLTTHYMEEAAESDYVVILDSGKKVASGTPNELKERFSSDTVKVYNTDEKALIEKNIKFSKENGYLKIDVPNISEAKKLILENPDIFNDFEVIKGKMDDVFINATGKELAEGKEND